MIIVVLPVVMWYMEQLTGKIQHQKYTTKTLIADMHQQRDP